MTAINDLATLAVADVASGDYLPIYDASASTDKKTALFASGTWTPVLAFGGSSVGIAYGTQTGQYTRVGKIVWVSALIVLTSKGSATGVATVSGLPVAVADVSVVFPCLGFSLGASVSAISGLAVVGGSAINLYYTPAAGDAGYLSLTNTQAGNSSIIYISGVYKA
jgi:hypothetical protein